MRTKGVSSLIFVFLIATTVASQAPATPGRDAVIKFLLKAKVKTYASQGDEATVKHPLLPGTHQLEFSEGPFLYRDIYNGNATFAARKSCITEAPRFGR